MGVGIALLKKMIEESRPLSMLSDSGLDSGAFVAEEATAYKYIDKYYRKYHKLPTWATVKKAAKLNNVDFPDEPISYWLDQVEARHKVNTMATTFREVSDMLAKGDDYLDTAIQRVRELALRLDAHTGGDRVSKVSDLLDSVLVAHDARQISVGLSGVPFGLEYLDKVSDGAQPTDTVALVGRPGVGKTYFVLNMARIANISGAVPLFVPMEMSAYQSVRRLTALEAQVPATSIRLGRLSYWGRDKLDRIITEVKKADRPPFYLMEGTLTTTVEDIVMRVEELRPTILYIDGAYLVQTKTKHKAKWERVSEVAEYLKMIAKDYYIPVIATWQFNRKGPGSLGNIMYSDSVGQLASIVAGIENEQHGGKDEWEAKSTKIFNLLKGREGESGRLRVLYDMNRMVIKQIEVLTGSRR